VKGRSLTDRLIRAFVRVFPFDFRADHGRDLEQTLRNQHWDARRDGRVTSCVRLWLDVLRDLLTTAPREHVAVLRQDVGYALRALRRAPVFAVSAVLTLAIGMSVMTGMITVANSVLLRPLAVDHPERLISISNRESPFHISYKDLQDYRAETSVLSDAIGYVPRVTSLNADGRAERITLELVTDNYFSVLGVQPAAGRLIQPNEGRAPGDAPVIVLAYDYWLARFGGDLSVVGRSVRLGSQPFTVIGVSSRSFRGTESLLRVSAYVPAWMVNSFMSFGEKTEVFEDRGVRMFAVLGRLRPGVTLEQARARLDVRAALLARDYPQIHKDIALRIVPETRTRPTPALGEFVFVSVTALTGLAGLVLLITSANVANLLMARAAGRGREVALRAALGARLGRIARQFLTEGITVALLGALVAVPVVVLSMNALRTFLANVTSILAIDPDFSVDLRVLAVALAIAIGAGIVAGLAPAVAAYRSDPGNALKGGGRGATGGSGSRFGSVLVIAQVALSLTLLVSGGLFVRSLDRARGIDLGFEPDGMFLASAAPALQGYDFAKRLAFYTAVRDRIAAMPGVNQAAWVQFPPLDIMGRVSQAAPEPRPSNPDWRPLLAVDTAISPEYFVTAGVRLVVGRSFDERDTADTQPVLIINETLASRFWPGQNPLGRSLTADGVKGEVVGVVRNGKYQNVAEPPRLAIFRPLTQASPVNATIAIRSSRAPAALAREVRQVIQAVDSNVAVYDVRSMKTHLDNGGAFFLFRLAAFMTGLFGSLGVLLASIGLYGMIAYHVGQRTQEFGVRMALGAGSADIMRDVLARGARLAGIGVMVGIILALGLAQPLRGLLAGVSPFDPLIYASVTIFVGAISGIASFVPARRAIAVDPLIALRAE
jgi:predicted permease